MEITDAQVIKFANERVRVFADLMAKSRAMAVSIVEDYNAQNIGSKINNAGAGLLISDGSEKDGRPRITGGQIYNMITLAQDYVKSDNTGFITTDRASVINGIKVQG